MISIVIISKDERALDETLTEVRAQTDAVPEECEVIVVDASDGRLDDIRDRHAVRWLAFRKPDGVRISIPHQRNVGVRAARGDTVIFTDAGCRPRSGWLTELLWHLRTETVVAGIAAAPDGRDSLYTPRGTVYLRECPTINLAFHRSVFDEVGGFDESFEYGSDVDFSWRIVEAGHRIRCAPEAVVEHDWGDVRRQLRRSFLYGKARARLYRKHTGRLRHVLRDDPVAVLWPLFLLGLPLALRWRWYPLLVLIPLWRNRNGPVSVQRILADHVLYGLGVLVELARRR